MPSWRNFDRKRKFKWPPWTDYTGYNPHEGRTDAMLMWTLDANGDSPVRTISWYHRAGFEALMRGPQPCLGSLHQWFDHEPTQEEQDLVASFIRR